MRRALLVLPLLATTVACNARPAPSVTPDPGPSASSRAVAASPPASEPPPMTAEQLVHDRSATLMTARVSRTGTSVRVTSLWRVGGPRSRYVVARSDDGFATGTFERVSQQAGLDAVNARPDGAPRFGGCNEVAGGTTVCADANERITWTNGDGTWTSVPVAGLDGFRHLLVGTTGSLARDTLAVVGGGDGATLFPFHRVARSRDGGATWTTHDLPTFDGETAYVSGRVVLDDGRLVAALTSFSDDRRNRPAARSHGLWVSNGDDWSSMTPYEPRFVPALPPSDGYGPIASVGLDLDPDPVVVVTTTDGRVYASPDGVRPFRELPVR